MSPAGARPYSLSPLVLAVAAALGALQAHAQSTPSPQVLPEVTVKASPSEARPKEAESGALGDLPLLSTPFSINVVTRELIENQQASFLGDFLKNDPSAAIGNVVVSFATLRGFALGTDGFLLNGMRLGYPLSDGRVAMQAFERVDVLKGASAFLYGLGSTGSLGGAINYVPKAPPERPVRDVALTYDSKSQLGISVDVGDRLGAQREFGYRVNVGFRDGDTAVDEMSWKQTFVSALADWRIARDVVLQAGVYYSKNDFKNMTPFFVGVSDPEGNPIAIPSAPDTSRSITPSWSRFGQESTIGWLRADWAFAKDWSASFHYGAGRDDRPNDGTQDTRFGSIGSTTGDTLLFASEERSRTDVQALQALVHGTFATGSIQHQVSLGASEYEQKGYSSFSVVGFVPGNLYTGSGSVPQGPFVPIDGMPYTGKTKSSSFLVSDIVGFGEQWSVLVGGRQAKVTAYDDANTVVPGGEISKFTPVGAVMFKPTASSLVYFNYAQGLEPGGTAPVDAANANEVLRPLVTEQYEIGAKFDTGTLGLTAAIFDMKKPLQFRDASNRWVEGGEQRHKGLELVVTGQITPQLRVVSGLMYLDAKQEGTGSSATDGKRVPGVPEWTANAYLDYQVAAVPGLFVNAGVYYSDKQYFDVANVQSIPSWTRVDIGGRYQTRIAGKPTTFYLAVENVGGRDYWASALGSALTLGDPLTVKATARMSF
ncbi:Ferric-anguibactin receptor FatA [Usitatibacter rugosus]|uniref:Ferric-anguibactin receptor FatA n=1 Tax=Usitatibacter rugosus TaxID=2732067 RepID=A0A6M4GW13_9PROT|nr:TonB-dependent siderophore receptor [Usitatibacter rugosus]QJR10684.1 Ferric-anguibactin receptor FatA [Usitatibacter rugosus]